jgi:hypothetical protein
MSSLAVIAYLAVMYWVICVLVILLLSKICP